MQKLQRKQCKRLHNDHIVAQIQKKARVRIDSLPSFRPSQVQQFLIPPLNDKVWRPPCLCVAAALFNCGGRSI